MDIQKQKKRYLKCKKVTKTCSVAECFWIIRSLHSIMEMCGFSSTFFKRWKNVCLTPSFLNRGKYMDPEKKEIKIQGQNNRYQINKLNNKDKEHKIKMRKGIDKTYYPDEFFTIEKQSDLLSELYINNTENKYLNSIKSQLDTKLSSYKQQDILKKRLHKTQFVDIKYVVSLLHDSNMSCHYCKEKMYLLYDIVREMKQWTMDRINNNLGHNIGNVLPACLDCNLKRRRTNKDSFLFTKQLNVVKTQFS